MGKGRKSRRAQPRRVAASKRRPAQQAATAEDQDPEPAARRDQPPRPDVPRETRQQTEQLLELAKGGQSYLTILKRHETARKHMLPQRYDPEIAIPDELPEGFKTIMQQRQVRTPHLLLQNLMTTAMAAIGEYDYRFRPRKQVQPIGVQSEDVGADPFLVQAGESAEVVIERLLEDHLWEDIQEAWVQDADLFGTGCIKATWRSEAVTEGPLTEGMREDAQDQQARLQALMTRFAHGELKQWDPEAEELRQLMEAVEHPGELELDLGIAIENVPLPMLYGDPSIDDPTRIYEGEFFFIAYPRTRRQLRAENPYRAQAEDGSWQGAHPVDIDNATPFGMTTNQWQQRKMERMREKALDDGEGDPILVFELWHRGLQRVFHLVDGIPYPLRSWVPQKQPKQWYPLHFLTLRRVPGEMFGIGLVELGAELQRTSNLKATDDNLMRWLALPRYLYDTGMIDDEVMVALSEVLPGCAKGVDMRGQDIRAGMMELKQQYDPAVGDDAREKADMRMVGNMPEQMHGSTGVSHHAAEVKAAMQGAQVSKSYVASRTKRAKTRLMKYLLELAYMNLPRQIAMIWTGRYGIWPEVYDADEAKRLEEFVDRRVKTQLLKMQWLASSMGRPMNELTWRQHYQQERERLLTEMTGLPQLITRENIFDLLDVTVEVSENEDLEAAQKRASFNEAIQTASAGGLIAQPQQLGRVLCKLYGLDEEFAELWSMDPNMLAQQLLQMMGQNPQALAPELLQQLAVALAPAVGAMQAQPQPAKKTA